MVNKTQLAMFILSNLIVMNFSIAAHEQLSESSVHAGGAEFYMSQNVGAGTFFKEYKQKPYVASNFFAFPYYQFGPFTKERVLKIHAEVSSAFEWMGANNPFPGRFAEKILVGDIKIRGELKRALFDPRLGLSLTPGLKVEFPTSKSARIANRVIGLGGFLVGMWTMHGWFLTIKPLLIGYLHSVPYKTDVCADGTDEEARLPSGKCKVSGSQSVLLLKNSIYAGYQQGNHTFTLSFRLYHSFLRPLANETKHDSEPSPHILEKTLGTIEYAYKMPFDVSTTGIIGISGEQAYYDAKASFRMPFFSFAEPAKNVTEAYLALNVTF